MTSGNNSELLVSHLSDATSASAISSAGGNDRPRRIQRSHCSRGIPAKARANTSKSEDEGEAGDPLRETKSSLGEPLVLVK